MLCFNKISKWCSICIQICSREYRCRMETGLYEDGEDKTAAIGTSGKTNQVLSDSSIKGNKVFDLHSHPDNAYASENDMQLLDPGSKGAIYHVKTKRIWFSMIKKHAHIEGQKLSK